MKFPALIAALLAWPVVAGELPMLSQVETRRDVPVVFSELRMNPLLTEPLRLNGTLTYTSQGELTKQIASPVYEVVRLSDTHLLIEREGRRRRVRLKRMPDVAAFYSVLRALLDADTDAIDAAFTVTEERKGERWSARLVPRAMPLKGMLTEMTITGFGSQLARIHIEQPGDSWQTLTIAEPQAP